MTGPSPAAKGASMSDRIHASDNRQHRKVSSALLLGAGLMLLGALLPGLAVADHPCSVDPNWPDGQLCNTDPNWPAGQNDQHYDPNCATDGDPLNFSSMCLQEGEIACTPMGGGGCMECWDCIDNDNDGLFDCMDNIDMLGNPSTGGGCYQYCQFINPITSSGAFNQDQDGDGFLNCPTATNPDPSVYDCDDSDPAVHSGATEVCSDGIDNDCDGDMDGIDTDCGGPGGGDDDDDSSAGDDDDSGPADDDDSSPVDDDDSSGSSSDDDDSSPPPGAGGDGCACAAGSPTAAGGLGLLLLAASTVLGRRRPRYGKR
ncbi:MAG: hypothetical protein CMP23_13940 [Rickettsiales bacterium]|nr:hypothetical protein [Rickettsiales bacterium]